MRDKKTNTNHGVIVLDSLSTSPITYWDQFKTNK